MCGIFGYITRAGQGPDLARLRRIALVTQTRGEHAFGLAWLNRDGSLGTFRRPGPAQDHLDALEQCRNAIVIVGHCRLATHGSPQDNRNNHPHPAGAGYLVHNGVIFNHRALVSEYRLWPQTQCDSEVMGLLMARCRGSILQRAAWAAGQAEGDLAVLGVWRRPHRLLIARRGRPLHFGEARDGYYLASLMDGLPGQVKAITDNSAHVLICRDNALRLESRAIRNLHNSAADSLACSRKAAY